MKNSGDEAAQLKKIEAISVRLSAFRKQLEGVP